MPAMAFSYLMCGFLNRAAPLQTVTVSILRRAAVIGNLLIKAL